PLRPTPRTPLFPYTTLFRSRKPVNATRAVVMLMAEPRTAPVSLRPSFLSTATTPKQVADSSGSVICHGRNPVRCPPTERRVVPRSEEHTSELQSRFDLVCRL